MLDGSFQRSLRLINQDIRNEEAKIVQLNGDTWEEEQAELSPEQIAQKRADEIAIIDAALVVLNDERDARMTPRSQSR